MFLIIDKTGARAWSMSMSAGQFTKMRRSTTWQWIALMLGWVGSISQSLSNMPTQVPTHTAIKVIERYPVALLDVNPILTCKTSLIYIENKFL